MLPTDLPPSAQEVAERAGLSRTFVLIVLVEIATLVALFVFGRHFAQP
jgi:hypothetical protein